jgi:hypothetical protein
MRTHSICIKYYDVACMHEIHDKIFTVPSNYLLILLSTL